MVEVRVPACFDYTFCVRVNLFAYTIYRMFNQQELQVLLGGVNTPIDVDDLRSHTNYGGLYDDNEPTIVAFWNVSPFLVA